MDRLLKLRLDSTQADRQYLFMRIPEITKPPLHGFQFMDVRRAGVAAAVTVTLLVVSGVTSGQQAGPSAGGPRIVKNDPARAFIQNKLNSIIIPRVDFEDAAVEEAIDFVRLRATQLDVIENDPAKRGLNFVIRNPRPAAAAAGPAPKIRELRLKNVPLGILLRYICDLTNLRYTVDDFAVILAPKDPAGPEPAKPAEK